MAKKQIKSGLYVHENHIDIDVPLGLMPFDIQLGEELYCAVKGQQKRGIHTDYKAHIFVTKKDTISINEAIKDVEDTTKTQAELKSNKKLILKYKNKIKHQTKLLNDMYKRLEKEKIKKGDVDGKNKKVL